MIKKLFNLQNFIYLTIFAVPFYLIKLNFFGIPVNILDILMTIVVFWWLTEIVFKRQKLNLPNYKYLIPIALILIGITISTTFNYNKLHNWSIVKSWFILPIFFSFITYSITSKRLSVEKILQTIHYSTFAVSLVALSYFFSNNLTYDYRLSAFYLSPNYLAMYLTPGLIIAFYKLSSNFKNGLLSLNLFFNFFAITILSSAIYLTFSYATWLALSGSFLLIFFLLKKMSPLVFLAMLLLSAIILGNQFNNPKFQNLLNPTNNSSLTSRIAIWKSAGKILSDNWLWGIGADNFQEKYLAYQKYFPPYPEWAVPQPHNLYLAFWLHCGLFGFIGFLWLIVVWLKNQLKIIFHPANQKQKKSAVILLTIILYILLHGIIDTPIWKNDLSLIFWLIIFIGIKNTKK